MCSRGMTVARRTRIGHETARRLCGHIQLTFTSSAWCARPQVAQHQIALQDASSMATEPPLLSAVCTPASMGMLNASWSQCALCCAVERFCSFSGYVQGLSGWPKLCLQVWSVDSHGRTDIAGYGFVNLPTAPGMYDLECPTWVPEGTARAQVPDPQLWPRLLLARKLVACHLILTATLLVVHVATAQRTERVWAYQGCNICA
jgi:Ciliary basal body-associated, B9 protein